MEKCIFLFWLAYMCVKFDPVQCQGLLIDPPGRNAVMNLQGQHVGVSGCNLGATNTNDSAQACGGKTVQDMNNGKCSACGDNYASSYPRPHDYGGKYAKHITATRVYLQGQTIKIKVKITVQHGGNFTFKLCPHVESDNDGTDVLTKCYDDPNKYKLLHDVDGHAEFGEIKTAKVYNYNLNLPADLTCEKGCSLQWLYETDTSLTFVNCADIMILKCAQYKVLKKSPTWCGRGATPELQTCHLPHDRRSTKHIRSAGGNNCPGQNNDGGDEWYDSDEGNSEADSDSSDDDADGTDNDNGYGNSNDGDNYGDNGEDNYGGSSDDGYGENEGNNDGNGNDNYGDSTDDNNGGSTGDSSGGSTGDSSGGSTGDNSGGNTGDNSGGNTGENNGGSTGDNSGGSTGDNNGGSTGDNNGGSTGDNSDSDDGSNDDDSSDSSYVPSCQECQEENTGECANDCCEQTVTVTGVSAAFNTWCYNNCFHNPPYCPASHCNQNTEWVDACDTRRRLERVLRKLLLKRGITLK